MALTAAQDVEEKIAIVGFMAEARALGMPMPRGSVAVALVKARMLLNKQLKTKRVGDADLYVPPKMPKPPPLSAPSAFWGRG